MASHQQPIPLAATAGLSSYTATSITSPDDRGERVAICRNPNLAAEGGRIQEDLLAATEKDLARMNAKVC
jgi:hypothetical protein